MANKIRAKIIKINGDTAGNEWMDEKFQPLYITATEAEIKQLCENILMGLGLSRYSYEIVGPFLSLEDAKQTIAVRLKEWGMSPERLKERGL